jgi:Tol biopolymer transport system component
MIFERRFCRRVTLLTFLIVILSCAQPLLAASTVKLNGSLPAAGDVGTYAISPDGRYAVYQADQDTEGVVELYSVFLWGGAPVRLNPSLPAGRNVTGWKISPDSSRVVYLADRDTDEVFELYSVPLSGPASDGVKLNRPLVEKGGVFWGDVSQFLISPDSSRVVYLADQDINTANELYSVPLAGPASDGVKLNRPLGLTRDVEQFRISPDSSRVVYRADQETYHVPELYSVPLVGPAEVGVKLNKSLVLNGVVSGFEISPDSSRVVYRADQDSDEVFELYSVPVGGPAENGKKLTEWGFAGDVHSFNISPDSSRVVYLASQTNNSELFSIHISGQGAPPIKLNPPLVQDGIVNDFKISPDSSRVVYRANQETHEIYELYSVPLTGPAEAGVKLNGPLIPNREVWSYQISPNSSRVVYTTTQNYDLNLELNSVPLQGPAENGVRLNRNLGTTGAIAAFEISPDSSRVVYRADQDSDDVFELYRVPLAGPAEAGVKLNGQLVLFGDVGSFLIGPDSSKVLYAADQDKDGVTELYMIADYLLYLPLVLR